MLGPGPSRTGERRPPVPVRVRYWAAARALAGVREEDVVAHTLAEALGETVQRHGDRFGAVVASCSFLVDDVPVGAADPASVPLVPGATVEVLPPFAGG